MKQDFYKRMKVAFTIFDYFPYGGLQLDFYRMTLEAVSRKHAVTVVCSSWEGPRVEGVSYQLFPSRKWTNWGKALDFEAKACRFLAENTFDLVVGFNRMKGADLYFAADNCFGTRSRKKGFFTRLLAPRYRVFERMEESIFSPESSTKILYLTENQKQDFMTLYGTPEKRFYYLAPGVADSFCVRSEEEYKAVRQKIRNEFGIKEGKKVLIQVCSAFHTKGLDRTIRALALLEEKERENTVLLAVGREKPFSMLSLVRKLSIPEENVIFTGGRSDVADLLCGADLMVHPARNEATGGVLAEALCSGVPVIASGCCGYSPLVRESGGIVLEEPFRQEELNGVLQKILASDGELASLREKGLAYGKGKALSFHNRAERAVEIMERLVKYV